MIHYCLGFLFNEDFTKVVLIRKNKPNWQKGLLNGVGGKIESHEISANAMTREFFEEAGICIATWKQFAYMKGGLSSESYWRVDCFYARASDRDMMQIYSPTSEQVKIYSVGILKRLKTVSNLQWLIPLAVDHHININYEIKILL